MANFFILYYGSALLVILNFNSPSGAYINVTLYSRGLCRNSNLYDRINCN